MGPTSMARALLAYTGLGTDPSCIAPSALQKTALLLGTPRASPVGGTHLAAPNSTSIYSAPQSWQLRTPRRVWGGSYLQGCRVSKGLQGLQGLSSVGLWLLGDKLQGKTCRCGVSGCHGHPGSTARARREGWGAVCVVRPGAKSRRDKGWRGNQGWGAQAGWGERSEAELEGEHRGLRRRCGV